MEREGGIDVEVVVERLRWGEEGRRWRGFEISLWVGRQIRFGQLRKQGVAEVPLRRSNKGSRWHGVKDASNHAPADSTHGVIGQWSRVVYLPSDGGC